MVLLSRTVLSSVAYLDLTDFKGFTSILVLVEAVALSGSGHLYARLYLGGALDTSANYSYNYVDLSTGTLTGGNASAQTIIRLTGTANGSRNISGVAWLQGVDHTSDTKWVRGDFGCWTSNLNRHLALGTRTGVNTACTGIRIASSAATMDAGRISFYGVT
jgi:hypothetical protein